MAIKKTDRDALLEAALRLFRVQGYHHTSMADIGKASGLLKGSIYHYFPGKKELAMAALDQSIEEVREKLFQYADDSEMSADERLSRLADAVEHYFTEREGGCVMGNLALEVGDSIPEFGERIRAYFDEWVQVLMAILGDRFDAGEARLLAEDAVARMQGAIMIMGIKNDPAILRRAGRDTVALLKREEARGKGAGKASKRDKERTVTA